MPLGCRRFGLFRFRSPLLSESRFLSFPSGTEMVHFPEFARHRLWIHRRRCTGLPYRVSPFGNPRIIMPACGSPGLIAACHVLHRLLLPRHPPCALSNLTIKFTSRTPCPRGLRPRFANLQSPLLDLFIDNSFPFRGSSLPNRSRSCNLKISLACAKEITRLACIFTHSIQLSNIVLEIRPFDLHSRRLSGFEHSCSMFKIIKISC